MTGFDARPGNLAIVIATAGSSRGLTDERRFLFRDDVVFVFATSRDRTAGGEEEHRREGGQREQHAADEPADDHGGERTLHLGARCRSRSRPG